MQSYKLPVEDAILPINHKKKYRLKPLDTLKVDLSNTKSKLDEAFKQKSFSSCWRECDPFTHEKKLIAHIGNTYNVSNAWLKCYELINYYDLMKQNKVNGKVKDKVKEKDNVKVKNVKEGDEKDNVKVVHFDNAAFPGSFVISAHHYAVVNDVDYEWFASSLIDKNEQTSTPLSDKYELYMRNPDQWLMNEHNNGDVLVRKNQMDFKEQVGGKITLYTSDLGFDVSNDYNNQELIQCPANIGQIISGLLTLKKGGCFITKQFTTFEPITITVMYAAAQMFDEFYLCKPFTSREANSETYLVGKGFKGYDEKYTVYIEAMFDRIEGKTSLEIPLFDAQDLPKAYLKTIIKASETIFKRQIKKINEDLKRCSPHIPIHLNESLKAFKKESEPEIIEWYKQNIILPISDDQRLNMKDAYRQGL